MADQVVIKIGANASGAIAAFGLVAGAAQAMAGRVLSFSSNMAAALPRAIKTAIDSADKLYESSKIAGVNVKDFSALAYAADQSSVSIQDLETAARYLAKTHNAALLPTLLQTAEEFETIGDEVQKIAIAQERFGKSGSGLIPLLSEGKGSIQALIKEANMLGVAIGPDLAKAADTFNDSWARLSYSLKGFAYDAANFVLPALQAIASELNTISVAARALKMESSRGLMATALDVVKAGIKPGFKAPSLMGFASHVADGLGPLVASRLMGSLITGAIQQALGSDTNNPPFPNFNGKQRQQVINVPESRASSAFTSRGFLSQGEAQMVSRTASFQKNVQTTLAEILGLQRQYLPKMAESLS